MRREPAAALAVATAGGLLLLVAEPAVGLVALAGTGAALLLRPGPRRVVAAVLAALGAVGVVAGASAGDWLVVGGVALLAVAGAVATVRSARWPAPRRGPRDRSESPPGSAAPPTDRDTWAALDRGEDPTA